MVGVVVDILIGLLKTLVSILLAGDLVTRTSRKCSWLFVSLSKVNCTRGRG